jgi:hypothetical protein
LSIHNSVEFIDNFGENESEVIGKGLLEFEEVMMISLGGMYFFNDGKEIAKKC